MQILNIVLWIIQILIELSVTGANFLHAIFIEASFIDAIKDKALFSYAGIKIFEKKITDNNVNWFYLII